MKPITVPAINQPNPFEAPPSIRPAAPSSAPSSPLPKAKFVPLPQMEQLQQFVAGKIGNQAWRKGKKLEIATDNPNVVISRKSGQRFDIRNPADMEGLFQEAMVISGGSGQLNYYEVLGVDKTATHDQIKKAYRNLARENHPDATKNLPEKERKKREERFKEINEAYGVLDDEARRKAYDSINRIKWGDAEEGQPPGSGYYPAGLNEIIRTHSMPSNIVIIENGERKGQWCIEGKNFRYINPNTREGEAELIRIITGEGNVQRPTPDPRIRFDEGPQGTQVNTSEPEIQKAQIVADLGKSWELLTGNAFGVAPKKLGVQTVLREVRKDDGNLLKIALIRFNAGDKVVELPFLPQDMSDQVGFTRRLRAFNYFLQGWGLSDDYIIALNKIVGQLMTKHLAGQLQWRSER